ncbi:Mini-ribonuclease 3 [Synechococcus sp. PCC 7336]|uniref:Mini-ribonuclease 3 n=1 Tax=Synechococcus sp. PCC 7336 TaxID=195250 RepID=UPI000348B48B|nr:ribonuclease III domain-containing protein [Synechococcus sp. PCC 7336]
MTGDAPSIDIKRLSPAALAYLGDAVYELHVRRSLLIPPQRLQAYHRAVVACVQAEAQAKTLASIAPTLSDAEQAIVQRGRNNCGSIPRRVSPEIYRAASGFEALLGYLYLQDGDRLQEILQVCDTSFLRDD